MVGVLLRHRADALAKTYKGQGLTRSQNCVFSEVCRGGVARPNMSLINCMYFKNRNSKQINKQMHIYIYVCVCVRICVYMLPLGCKVLLHAADSLTCVFGSGFCSAVRPEIMKRYV